MFPLLHLDRVSLDEVLRNMTPIELFNLSLCSKIALLNIKDLIRRTNKNWFPSISIAENCSVDVIYQKNYKTEIKWPLFVHGTERLGIENVSQPIGAIKGIQFTGVVFENGDKMDTYWQNEDDGLKALIEYMEDLYGNSAKLYFGSDDPGKLVTLIRMIDWDSNRLKPIEFANINLNVVDDDNELAAILNSLKYFKKLYLEMTPGEDFINNDHRAYEYESVSFSGTNWFNLQRLLNMKCQKIKGQQTTLTNADINWYIKSWMQGLNPTLEHLILEVNNLDLSRILSDIPHTEKVAFISYGDQEIASAFNICRHDGKVAEIFELNVDPTRIPDDNFNFGMSVWH